MRRHSRMGLQLNTTSCACGLVDVWAPTPSSTRLNRLFDLDYNVNVVLTEEVKWGCGEL